MSATAQDEWLNLSDAAALLGVHPSTLRAWSDRGDIPTHRTPGNHRRFRRVDVETWVDSRRQAQATPGQLIVDTVLGRTRIPFEEMVKLDYLYVMNWSLWNDIRLILRTLPTVIARRGAN